MNFFKKRAHFRRWGTGLMCFFLLSVAGAVRVQAVIEENAEKLDVFKEEDLKEFQANLTQEEQLQQNLKAEEKLKKMDNLGQAAQTAGDQGEKLTKQQIEELRKKLLGVKKKDRLRFGLDGTYTYNSNNSGGGPGHEKPENQFNTRANTQFNFSGKKTEMGLELRGTKNWNIYKAINDSWQAEERLRSRRKFFKRINVNASSRIARNSAKTLEISSNKIRWDAANQMSTNFAFSRKLALNLDLNSQKRLFLQEAFDQDSGWQATANPSGFWNVTPKSRISFGYGQGVNRNRQKSGNSNSRDYKLGYFGQVTRKSSASVDLSLSRQNSFKSSSRTTSITVGTGYIWQWTAKVQSALQLTRGFSNTTSESVTGDTTDSAVVQKTDDYALNDNVALSFNYRMSSRVSLTLTSGIADTKTVQFVDKMQQAKTHIMTFPTSLGASMTLTRWLKATLQYSFSYKTGNEKTDFSRVHTLSSAVSMNF